MLAGLVAGLLLVLTACGGDDAGAEFRGAVLDQPYTVPDTALTDTEGQPFSLAKDTTKPLTLVFFGYINCPDICQVVMSALASAMTRLDASDRSKVDVVFVTTDPQRDTESALRTYLDRYDPSFIGLTGDIKTIASVGKPLAIAVLKGEKLPSGGYEVVHSTQVSAIDGQDQVPVLWTQGTSAAQFAADIHTLLGKES
nr:SCO family protein [Nocardioides luti]